MPPSGLPTHGPALRAIRERTGLSKAELARRAGVAHSTVSRAESGQLHLTPAVARAVAEALDVPVTAILYGQGEAQ